MDHFPYLFAAYTVVWTVLFLYVLSLDRRGRRAEKEIDDLRRLVEGDLTKPGGSQPERRPGA